MVFFLHFNKKKKSLRFICISLNIFFLCITLLLIYYNNLLQFNCKLQLVIALVFELLVRQTLVKPSSFVHNYVQYSLARCLIFSLSDLDAQPRRLL